MYPGEHNRPAETADIETASESYAERFSGQVGEYFLSVQWHITRQLLGDIADKSILDVGGGHGQLAVPLINNGANLTITGSDGSCRRRLDRFLEKDQFDFHVCDMLNLPFHKGQFEVVIAFRLLPHVLRWKKLLAELCRVSQHMVIVDFPDIRSFNILTGLLFERKKAIEGNTRPYRLFHRNWIASQFAKNGFHVSEHTNEFFLPMVLHRWIKSVGISRGIEQMSSLLYLTKNFGSPVIMKAIRTDTLT